MRANTATKATPTSGRKQNIFIIIPYIDNQAHDAPAISPMRLTPMSKKLIKKNDRKHVIKLIGFTHSGHIHTQTIISPSHSATTAEISA